jgi:hypothetical protein
MYWKIVINKFFTESKYFLGERGIGVARKRGRGENKIKKGATIPHPNGKYGSLYIE